jgi:hypothetical protein
MNSSIRRDKEYDYHTFTNVELTGVIVKWEIRYLGGDDDDDNKTYVYDYHLFIRYGEKVYVDIMSVGEIVVSLAELQKNRYLKYYYDLSLMLTNNKNHIIHIIQGCKYRSTEPYIYIEDRYWVIENAFIDASYSKVVDNVHVCYYKINPYDLENMEYTSQEDLTKFHKINIKRKCDIYWGGLFESIHTRYNNLVIDYNINIIEKELDELSTFFEDKKNVINLVALNNKEGMNGDVLKIIFNFLVSCKGFKRYYGIINNIENCKNKNKLEMKAQILEA